MQKELAQQAGSIEVTLSQDGSQWFGPYLLVLATLAGTLKLHHWVARLFRGVRPAS